MLPARIVTTSWDDGDPSDRKVAELLRARGLAGTFYVPLIGYDGRRTLDTEHLRMLASEGFEIGAHGTSHNALPHLGPKEIAREVRICKSRLEDILGGQVQMFCYPKGRHSAEVVRHLKETGYMGARTNRTLGHKLDFTPFEMPTTLQVYHLRKSGYLRNAVRAAKFGAVFEYLARVSRANSWVELGKAFFDLVLRQGGVWHLYGHSWQIEEMGLWDELRQMLDYVSNREGVTYVSNRGVLNFLPANTAPVSANHLIPSK